MTYQEGTNGLPRPVEETLIQAKDWHDRHEKLKQTIASFGGSAQRNQEDLDEFSREASDLLTNIVLAVESTWGWK